jgi:hypothetical protein
MSPLNLTIADDQNQPRPLIIFLTGAPDCDKLDWLPARLLADLQGRPRKYLSLDDQKDATEINPASHSVPKWRTIECSFDKAANHTGPDDPPSDADVELLSFENDIERSEFLDHTLESFHESEGDATEGGVQAADDNSDQHVAFITISSTDISFDSLSNSISESVKVADIKFPDSIQDLKTLPSACHLLSIQPQTVTVHLLVCVVTVETRTVQLRKRPGQMELVELLVGDETAAPFKVTFWLQHLEGLGEGECATAKADPDSARRAVLKSIRSGNILLLTNVALDVFKNATYGQSLTRRRAGPTTDVVNLSKIDLGSASSTAYNKFQSVRKWARDFVGIKDTSRDLPDKRDALPEWSPIEKSRTKRQRHIHHDVHDNELTSN